MIHVDASGKTRAFKHLPRMMLPPGKCN